MWVKLYKSALQHEIGIPIEWWSGFVTQRNLSILYKQWDRHVGWNVLYMIWENYLWWAVRKMFFLLKPNFYLFIQYFVSFLCMFGLFCYVSDYQKYNPNVSSTWNVRPLSELSHMWSKWYMGMYLKIMYDKANIHGDNLLYLD